MGYDCAEWTQLQYSISDAQALLFDQTLTVSINQLVLAKRQALVLPSGAYSP